jgi:hypothetical protein
MRIRKAVIAVSANAAARTPFVGHNVGGALLTRQALHVGQVVNLVGSRSGRISNYRVTAEHRDAGVYYVTVWPRLQTNNAGNLVLFTASN